MVIIFHFGLGERGAAGDAPINRLFAAIDKALFHDVREQAQFVGFVFLVEREIRIVPIAKDAEPFELHALDINELAGVGVAGVADGGGGDAPVTDCTGRRRRRLHFLRRGRRSHGLAHFLRDFEFNRQAVAVPAGNVRRAETAQSLIFDDDVLENLVQRGADVDVAVGERRAVVQDEFLRAGALLLNFPVKFRRFPFFQTLRLARHQVGFHGKVGARQVERVFVVRRHFQERER